MGEENSVADRLRGHMSDMSDEDVVIQYCLENKVSKTAMDELVKRGFTSLAALRLVQMDDLDSQRKPRGQSRLICHLAGALGRGANTTTSTQSAPVNSATPEADSESSPTPEVVKLSTTGANTYYATIINSLLAQQKDLADTNNSNAAGTSDIPNQPTWNDPQIHIHRLGQVGFSVS